MELKISILHLVFSLSVSMDICNRITWNLRGAPDDYRHCLKLSLFEIHHTHFQLSVDVVITQFMHVNYMIVFVYLFACHICYRLVDSLRDISYY